MRLVVLFAAASLAFSQTPGPEYDSLTHAYTALRARDYDTAVAAFLKAINAAPERASIHKDLAYAYLKIGENIAARDQFHEAMRIDSTDVQVAMEYAFLCFETKQQAEARRVFDRIRKTGNAVAEKAFQNIDGPMAAGIDRWKKAIALGSDNFSAHFDLATLAEQRGELGLAAEHYEKSWRLSPDHRSVLVDLGRVWQLQGKEELAMAALLGASRGGETRAAESAKELMPARYPYVPEFQKALELDPKNVELRHELGYLLLRMNRNAEAEEQFRILTVSAPDDLLAAAQLGMLLYGRGEKAAAMPLLQRVLDKGGQDLGNRVRAVLGMKQVVSGDKSLDFPEGGGPKQMAARSINAGYLKDALQYLAAANEADPGDFDVILKLAWTNNILHHDAAAYRWFEQARRSPDPKIAAEASHAWSNLRGSIAPLRTTAWFYPLFSTRWHDQFGYAQVKTELHIGLPVTPYLSVRFVGDTRETLGPTAGGAAPQYLSESSFIAGVGVRTLPWQGVTGWFEAGSAIGYLSGHMLPDYRGGISAARGIGRGLSSESGGAFADTTLDAIFVSRFGNDVLAYSQSRFGYTLRGGGSWAQLYLNGNATVDTQGQPWANFVETGPGLRFHLPVMPHAMYFTCGLLRGAYLINQGNPRGPNFTDFRAGVWYAFTH